MNPTKIKSTNLIILTFTFIVALITFHQAVAQGTGPRRLFIPKFYFSPWGPPFSMNKKEMVVVAPKVLIVDDEPNFDLQSDLEELEELRVQALKVEKIFKDAEEFDELEQAQGQANLQQEETVVLLCDQPINPQLEIMGQVSWNIHERLKRKIKVIPSFSEFLRKRQVEKDSVKNHLPIDEFYKKHYTAWQESVDYLKYLTNGFSGQGPIFEISNAPKLLYSFGLALRSVKESLKPIKELMIHLKDYKDEIIRLKSDNRLYDIYKFVFEIVNHLKILNEQFELLVIKNNNSKGLIVNLAPQEGPIYDKILKYQKEFNKNLGLSLTLESLFKLDQENFVPSGNDKIDRRKEYLITRIRDFRREIETLKTTEEVPNSMVMVSESDLSKEIALKEKKIRHDLFRLKLLILLHRDHL